MKKVITLLSLVLVIVACTRDHHSLFEPKKPAITPEYIDTSNTSSSDTTVVSLPPAESPCPTAYLAVADTFTDPYDTISWFCPWSINYDWQTQYGYNNIVVNPCNNDEIAYHKRLTHISVYQRGLYIYNFCTHTETEIASDVQDQFDWSSTGWFIYVGTDNQLYKVFRDGTQLTQLTNEGAYNIRPFWSPDGQNFIFSRVNANGLSFPAILANQDGIIKDTLKCLDDVTTIYQWVEPNIILGSGLFSPKGSVVAVDLNTKTIEHLEDNIFDLYPTFGRAFINESLTSLYILSIGKITKKDLLTNQRTTVAYAKYISGYGNMAIPEDEDPIYVIRNDFEDDGLCNLKAWSHIYVMDADGSNKLRLDLP
jgi:hypothetical protein